MIKYFTIEDLLKHYLQKKFHILKFTRKPHKKLPADNLLAGKILYFSIVYLTGSSSKSDSSCYGYIAKFRNV